VAHVQALQTTPRERRGTSSLTAGALGVQVVGIGDGRASAAPPIFAAVAEPWLVSTFVCLSDHRNHAETDVQERLHCSRFHDRDVGLQYASDTA